MHIFYTKNISGNRVILEGEEAHHISRVLRMKENAIINVCNGAGKLVSARIQRIARSEIEADYLETIREEEQADSQLSIAIAPTKNIGRFEWFLEKATEIGVRRIIPLICENSERKQIKMERLQRILIAAMKQSNTLWLPELEEMQSFETYLESSKTLTGLKAIAYCGYDTSPHLFNCIESDTAVCLCVGPEGDFSEKEIMQAGKLGFSTVSLGKRRLRTETAGVVGTQIVQDRLISMRKD